jgi:hypothetical protein
VIEINNRLWNQETMSGLMDYLGAAARYKHSATEASKHDYNLMLGLFWNYWVDQLACPTDAFVGVIAKINEAVWNSHETAFEVRPGGYWLTKDEQIIRQSMAMLEHAYGSTYVM